MHFVKSSGKFTYHAPPQKKRRGRGGEADLVIAGLWSISLSLVTSRGFAVPYPGLLTIAFRDTRAVGESENVVWVAINQGPQTRPQFRS